MIAEEDDHGRDAGLRIVRNQIAQRVVRGAHEGEKLVGGRIIVLQFAAQLRGAFEAGPWQLIAAVVLDGHIKDEQWIAARGVGQFIERFVIRLVGDKTADIARVLDVLFIKLPVKAHPPVDRGAVPA